MFDDWDFLDCSLSQYSEIYRKKPKLLEEMFHVNLNEYLYLLPEDVRSSITKYNSNKNKDNLIESLIVKSIYNAIKFRENNPKRLMNTTET